MQEKPCEIKWTNQRWQKRLERLQRQMKWTPYDPWFAYGRSKTANILFAVAFDLRHRDRGIRAAAVHPGGIRTELGRHMDPAHWQAMVDQINKQLAAEGKGPFQYKTIPQGAATSVWAGFVASADQIGAHYCENCHVSQIVPEAKRLSVNSEEVRPAALDTKAAGAVGRRSSELGGGHFVQG